MTKEEGKVAEGRVVMAHLVVGCCAVLLYVSGLLATIQAETQQNGHLCNSHISQNTTKPPKCKNMSSSCFNVWEKL
jgi:hypothetical protein